MKETTPMTLEDFANYIEGWCTDSAGPDGKEWLLMLKAIESQAVARREQEIIDAFEKEYEELLEYKRVAESKKRYGKVSQYLGYMEQLRRNINLIKK